MGLVVLRELPCEAEGEALLALAVRIEKPWDETRAVNAILSLVEDLGPLHWHVELPQVYKGKGRSAVQKDVELLTQLSERLGRELRPLGHEVTFYRPHAWKGNVPKSVHHRRLRRAMTSAEKAAMDDGDFGDAQLDVWDAAGLALLGAGRTGVGGRRV
jgi:hypothetical protein